AQASQVGWPPTLIVATTRGEDEAVASEAPARTTTVATTTASLRTGRLRAPPVEQRQCPVGPGDRRARVLEPVQQRQVGEEVAVAVDRQVDLLELGELLLRAALPLIDLRPERLGICVRAEEELEQEPVARHAAHRLIGIEPGLERVLPLGGDAV